MYTAVWCMHSRPAAPTAHWRPAPTLEDRGNPDAGQSSPGSRDTRRRACSSHAEPAAAMGGDLVRANAVLRQENTALRAAVRRLSRTHAALLPSNADGISDHAGSEPPAAVASSLLTAATPHGAPPAKPQPSGEFIM